MSKCNKCGKSGFFLRVNKDGLCAECSSQVITKEIQTKVTEMENDEPAHRPEIVNILPTGNTFEEQMKIDLAKSIKETQNRDRKFCWTQRDEELSFNFSQKYSKRIGEFESALYATTALAVKTKLKGLKQEQIPEQIELAYNAITIYNNFKEFCYGKGRGGTVYFQQMWEHCFNSRNPDFSFVDKVRERVIELEHLEMK